MNNNECCNEYEGFSRRGFLKLTSIAALAGVSTSVIGDAFMQTAYAGDLNTNTLVVLSLRGGVDGLSMVVPHGEQAYYQGRPSIAVPKARLLAQDSMFGLHPELAPLLPLWNDKSLAVVHAAGMITPNRSHFSAMEEIEDADPGSSARVGWLNRLLGANGATSPLNGIQYGTSALNTQLVGPSPSIAANEPSKIKFPADDDEYGRRRKAATSMLWQGNNSVLGKGFKSAMQAEKSFKPVMAQMAGGVRYPDNDLGRALKATASTIKAGIGAQVITVDYGSWDHHVWVGDLNDGNFKRMAAEFAQALAAFYSDLGSFRSKVTLATVSEFGRRLEQNATSGLDHGHGNFMFVIGDTVNGGKYYANWPGLTLGEDADLRATTDYRNVFGEIIQKRFPAASVGTVFPGLQFAPLGLLR